MGVGGLFEEWADGQSSPLDGLEGVPATGPEYGVAEPRHQTNGQDYGEWPTEGALEGYVDDQPADELDEQMSEAERRLHKATLYRQFLTGDVFEGEDQSSREVTDEFRSFARFQLAKLLGVDGPADPRTGLTEIELRVLKKMVEGVLQNAKMRAAVGVDSPPPARPPRPAAAARPPARPTLRPRPLPEDARPRQPAPAARRQQARPSARPQQQRPPAPQRQQPAVTQLPQGAIPHDEAVVKENGRTFKIRYEEIPLDVFVPKARARLQQLGVGSGIRLPNDMQVVRTGPETWVQVKRLDVTPQKTDVSTRVPMPRNMEAVLASQAATAVSNLPPSVSGLAGKIVNQ